ncbi:SIMPL domain-containing protein [Bombella sp. TMW 2.2559]|uniref:SIMPL domain-containing protein n=1 Tax=Bombella dulcis TaxID=2967339 RepID=A0ABT3WAP2_9PROT|nr:SIMPL domain-containing protein [Bombella dulcis]MCX5616149.1 SIMPL domain-containing protein [Bombella dulcis]
MSLRHPLHRLCLTALATGCLLGGATVSASPALAVPDGGAVVTTPPPPHPHGTLLSFSVSDEEQAKADTLSIHFSARMEGPSPTSTQQQLNQLISSAMAVLKDQPDVKTTADNYTVNEDYGPHNRKNWVARQSLTLSSQNRDGLLALAEKLQKMGLGIEDMQWTLNPETREKLEQQARLGALKKLRQQAEEDATALGQTLLGLERVRIGGHGPDGFEPHPPFGTPPMLMMARSASAPPESTAEMQTVRVTVHAQARLADREPPTP